MCCVIRDLIINTSPDFLVIEDVNLQTNPSALIMLSRLQGSIIQTCLNEKLSYKLIKPSSWRKILNFKQGKGLKRKQLKLQAMNYVKNKYGISANEDQCEAICILDAMLISINQKENLNV